MNILFYIKLLYKPYNILPIEYRKHRGLNINQEVLFGIRILRGYINQNNIHSQYNRIQFQNINIYKDQ